LAVNDLNTSALERPQAHPLLSPPTSLTLTEEEWDEFRPLAELC